jgi:flavodoxin
MAKPPKVLVVFFSRTGTTRLLAEAIARATQGDLEELRERRSRRGIVGWLRSGYEGTYQRSAETLPLDHDVSAYDLVFVGSPTWSRSLCSPTRGFLLQNAARLRDVALFATSAGQGAERVLEQMAALLKQPPLATLALLQREVERGAAVRVGELSEAALTAWERKMIATS